MPDILLRLYLLNVLSPEPRIVLWVVKQWQKPKANYIRKRKVNTIIWHDSHSALSNTERVQKHRDLGSWVVIVQGFEGKWGEKGHLPIWNALGTVLRTTRHVMRMMFISKIKFLCSRNSSKCFIYIILFNPISLWRRHCYYPHCPD